MRKQITIFTVLNGWVIQAGCQLVAYTDKATLLADFMEWTTDPAKAEKQLLVKAINRKVTMPDLQPQAPNTHAQPVCAPDTIGSPYPADNYGRAIATMASMPQTENEILLSHLHNATR